MKTISYGVPQGSILRPVLLFLCYIKGLPIIISDASSKVSLYADDTNLIIYNKSLNEIERTPHKGWIPLNNYFSGKKKILLLNPDKTNLI